MKVRPRNHLDPPGRVAIADLLRALEEVTGPDREIDEALAACFDLEGADYSSDASLSRELVWRILPHARLQVGYDVNGILPSANLSDNGERFSATAPTVPLSILRVLVAALSKRKDHAARST